MLDLTSQATVPDQSQDRPWRQRRRLTGRLARLAATGSVLTKTRSTGSARRAGTGIALSGAIAATMLAFSGTAAASRSSTTDDGCTQTGTTLSCGYVGHAATFTVPADVSNLEVQIAGASGGTTSAKATPGRGGAGYSVSGTLKVNPGDSLTIGVGGQGGNGNGKIAPGAGGWGLIPTATGGSGGSSRGLGAYYDGGGGGGATVIEINGKAEVIAAGGGGGAYWYGNGGDGGKTYGNDANWHKGGRGAGPDTNFEKKGGSIGSHGIGDGGGGGGGGWHNGEGGDAGSIGGNAGGGGNSKVDTMNNLTDGSSTGNGKVVLSWTELGLHESKPSRLDVRWLKANAQTDLAEISLGKLATMKSHNPATLKVAGVTAKQHRVGLTQLRATAKRLHVSLPAKPSQMQLRQASLLKQEAGQNFDKWYAKVQIAGHQLSIRQTKAEIRRGSNPAVVRFAKRYLPKAEMHLMLAKKLLASLNC